MILNLPRVLIDICMWVSFFNRPGSTVHDVIDRLIDDGRAVLVGPIVFEILAGFRRKEQADWVASRLNCLTLLELDWNHWVNAAELSRRLAAHGHRLPMSDLLIAEAAITYKCQVYSSDPHFDLLSWVDRFTPDE